MNNQKKGKMFEDRIHNILSFTKLKIYREKDIRSNYSSHISGIDHLLMDDDICIALQDKYVKSKLDFTDDDNEHVIDDGIPCPICRRNLQLCCICEYAFFDCICK